MGDVKQSAISYTKERCLKAAISELVDDYETIKREVVELREHNKYLEMRVSEESDYAELEARHNALVEAGSKLLESCESADADGDLSERVSGDLMFNFRRALEEK